MSYIISECDKISIKVTKSYYDDIYIGYHRCDDGLIEYRKLTLFTGNTFNFYQSSTTEICVPKNNTEVFFSVDGKTPTYLPDLEYNIVNVEDCSIVSDIDKSYDDSIFVTPTPTPTLSSTPECLPCMTYKFTLDSNDPDSYVKLRFKDCLTDNTRYIELTSTHPEKIACIKGEYVIVKNNKNDVFDTELINNNICTSECYNYLKCDNTIMLPIMDNYDYNDINVFYFNNGQISIDGCLISDCDYDGFVLGWYYGNETSPRFTSGWNVTSNRPVNSIEYPDGVDENQSCSSGFTKSVQSGIWKVKILRRFFNINNTTYFIDSNFINSSRSYFTPEQKDILNLISIIVYPDNTPLPSFVPEPTVTPTPTPTPQPTPTTCYDCFTIKVSLDSQYATPDRNYHYIYVPCSGINIGKVVRKTIKVGEAQTVCTFGVEEDIEGFFKPKLDNYSYLIRPFEEYNYLRSKDNQSFIITPDYTDNSGTKTSIPKICENGVCINLSEEVKRAFIYPRPLSFGVEEDIEGF